MGKRKAPGKGGGGGQQSAKRGSGKGGSMAQKMEEHSWDQARISKEKKADQRRRMRLKQLRRSIARAEEELREFMMLPDGVAAASSGDAASSASTGRAARGGKKKPFLKGAARPWVSLQPSEHGCGRRQFECDDWCDPDWRTAVQKVEVDLFDKCMGKFGTREETRAFCRLVLQLGEEQLASGQQDAAIASFRRVIELDETDAEGARRPLVAALMDQGLADEARVLLDSFGDDKGTEMAYTRALVEFISWSLLKEPGSTSDTAAALLEEALDANMHVAAFISGQDHFVQVVDPDVVDTLVEATPPGSIEEAMKYCSNSLSCWRDADGSQEWMTEHLSVRPDHKCEADVCWTNVKLFRLYRRAMDAVETAAAAARAAEESDDSSEEDD